MVLYSYFRSSASYRVRIALKLKGVTFETVPVHLVRQEQTSEAFLDKNPQGFVPALDTGHGILTQSIAIIEYLDETQPNPPLLPTDPLGRARVRALALSIACDIHPLNNRVVTQYLSKELGVPAEAETRWYQHWIARGFSALEATLAKSPYRGAFCHGDSPSLADICLVPQVYNARRFACDLQEYPTITNITERCLELAAFVEASPEHQPDAPR